MATLQGYLMAYKVRPREAVVDAPAWAARRALEKERVAARGQGRRGGVQERASSTSASDLDLNSGTSA